MTDGSEKQDKAVVDIEAGAERKLQERANPPPSPLVGLGVFGMVGWSVALPTIAGTFLGIWLDRIAPQTFPWTIALLLAGVVIGVVIAWNWIEREGRSD